MSIKQLFLIDGCLANAIFVLTTGTILAGYGYFLGASEGAISIITVLPTLMNVVQIFSAKIFARISRRKWVYVHMLLIHRLCLGMMFFLPVLEGSGDIKVLLLALLYGGSYLCGASVGTGFGNWMLRSIKEGEEGRFLGIKDSLSLLSITIMSLVAGRMLDYFKELHLEQLSFLIVGIVIIGFTIVDYLCLFRIQDIEEPISADIPSIREIIAIPLRDKEFCKVIIFYGLWNIALNIANPFYAIYMVGYLELDYFFVMLINMLASISRVIAAIIWGKLADKISWMWVNRVCVCILGIAVVTWMFTVESNYHWLLPLNQIFSGIAWGGIAISIFNIQFTKAPAENKLLYVSTNTAITSVIGFSATLVGVSLVKILPELMIGNYVITGIQWIFLVSGILMLSVAAYGKKYL